MDRKNLAFIDAQNLHLSTMQNGWKIDYKKFRMYLKDKYKIDEALYFFGFIDESQLKLYENLRIAGFKLRFREHHSALKGTKKGNVDTDIVFEIMKALIERHDVKNIFLVSGDGDFKKLIDYLIQKKRLGKILFPDRSTASSLYKHLAPQYYDDLQSPSVVAKIAYLKGRSP